MPDARARGLEAKDHADILRIAADFHAASAYAHHPLALAKIDALFDNALSKPDYFAVVAADSVSDRCEGYLMGVHHEHYFSYTMTVTDVGFYITPAYRGLGVARAMLKRLEDWAFREKGAAEISLGVSSGVADAAIVRFYQRLGYSRGYYGVIKKSR